MNHRHQDRRVRLKIVVSNLRLPIARCALSAVGRSPRALRCRRLPWRPMGGPAVRGVLVPTAVGAVCPPRKRGPRAVAGSTCTLDHDGCIVCADAGISVRVVALDGDDALCEDAAGKRAQIAVELVAPVRVGDTLLVHGGVAIGRLGARG